MTPTTMTARVRRTWSSTRCSMTGIFLSSRGEKTESCSHLPSRVKFTSPAALPPLFRIDRHEEIVALAAQQQHRHLLLLDLPRGLLIVLHALDHLVIDLLNDVAPLKSGGFRRTARLDVIDHDARGLGGKVQLAHHGGVKRLYPQGGQDVVRRFDRFLRRRRRAGLFASQHLVGWTLTDLDHQDLLLAFAK